MQSFDPERRRPSEERGPKEVIELILRPGLLKGSESMP